MTVELQMVECERRPLRLSVGGCKRLWLSAQGEKEPDPWASNALCRTCPAGAARAGGSVSSVADAVAAMKHICPRCLRVSDRMIRTTAPGHRVLCISCCNRHLECFRRRPGTDGELGEMGCNSKGGRPQLVDRLQTVRLIVLDATGQCEVELHNVVSAGEAVFALAREASGPMVFTRALPELCGRLAAASEDAAQDEELVE